MTHQAVDSTAPQRDSAMRIGIMGGTFDPIHIGHLVCAEEARMQFGLDTVIFMPAGHPALKPDTITSAEDRYLMTVLATASNPNFQVSRLEIDRPGLTYTIDTIRTLKEQYPNSELFFITGADAVFEILSWKDAEELSTLVTFIAATRPGYDLHAAEKDHGQAIALFKIEYIVVPALAVSSTDLRARCAAGKDIRYLTLDTVAGYIAKNRLYQTEGVS